MLKIMSVTIPLIKITTKPARRYLTAKAVTMSGATISTPAAIQSQTNNSPPFACGNIPVIGCTKLTAAS